MSTGDLIAAVCAHLTAPRRHDSATDLSPNEPAATADILCRAFEVARSLLPLASEREIDTVAKAAVAHIHGLGPLQPFFADPLVNEIMVNNGGDVWVEREGTVALAGRLDATVMPRLIERILSPLGRRLDRLSPIVDARLPDGSRVCAVIPPIAIDGPCLTLRRFGIRHRQLDDFASADVAALLRQIVGARCNVLISGATSSGKTSLLNVLASTVASGDRIITLEDTAELRLDVAHVLRLETRPATVDGTPAITMTDLVRASLRLRPDRLVVGEIRGAEVIDMLAAMNTGHNGSLSTCHANSALDALRRIESLMTQHSPNWPLHAVQGDVAASIDVVVHVDRSPSGERRVTEVLELAPPASGQQHRRLVVAGATTDELQRGRR